MVGEGTRLERLRIYNSKMNIVKGNTELELIVFERDRGMGCKELRQTYLSEVIRMDKTMDKPSK